MTHTQWLTIHWVSIAALLLTLTACSNEPSTQEESDEPLVLHNDSFVDSFLLTDDELHRWRFTSEQFVVEAFQQPLPRKLIDLLTISDEANPASAFRISGTWELLDNGHTLWLREINSDQVEGRPDIRLHVETTGPETLTIEGIPYLLAPSLPLREILPIRIYRAEVAEVVRGDRLRVKEEDTLRVVQLDGVICPDKGQPFGEEAIQKCAELLGEETVFVKVYRVDDEGRDIAQVWGPNYQYVNIKLLNAGLAWHDKRLSSDWVYATAEDAARRTQRGLWAQPNPIPPWDASVSE